MCARGTRLADRWHEQCSRAREGVSQPAASISSDTLLNLLNHTLQESDNTYAEAICRTQGLLSSATAGSYSAAFEAIAKALDTLGVNRSDYIQADGSGLSRHNLLTPRALVQLLSRMGVVSTLGGGGGIGADTAQWRRLLPLAGRSGTLSGRFIGTPLEGVLRAKTGTLGGVSALSGYVGECTFSMVVNNAPVPASTLRRGLDDIALAFGLHPSCNARARLKTDEFVAGSKPHLAIILADDLGWNDLQGFGSGNRMMSPQIAALAAEGIRFESYYTFKFCSPSRSQTLTGRFAYHLGQQTQLNLNPQTGCEWDSTQGQRKAYMCTIKCGLSLKYKMLPALLKDQGYSTHALGKWVRLPCIYRTLYICVYTL